VYAGGRGKPRQFAVSLSLKPDRPTDSNNDAEWEKLRSAFLESLLPALGAKDIRETDSIEA